jgi:HK97 gp10 family phage protein
MEEFDLLPAILEALPGIIDDHAHTIALKIARDAAELAPKRTGELADSISAERSDDGWDVIVGADYGPFVELGTIHAAAEPFLTPAAEGAIPDFENFDMEGALGKVK